MGTIVADSKQYFIGVSEENKRRREYTGVDRGQSAVIILLPADEGNTAMHGSKALVETANVADVSREALNLRGSHRGLEGIDFFAGTVFKQSVSSPVLDPND